MNSETDSSVVTRMLFLGDVALTDGFRLIGFETWSDPTPEVVEQILTELILARQNAFVILDSKLAMMESSALKKIRMEGGRIVITEVPSLSDPDNFHCEVDNKVRSLLGDHSITSC